MIREGWFHGRKTPAFTLQWHLTNACPYQCQHCYDRFDRQTLDLTTALKVVEDLRRFCQKRRVDAQVCLTGGDPLLYPHFWELYAAIAAAGMRLSILGNPVRAATIGRLMAIQAPDYYQVSLEGLEAHNDAIRGKGHFARVMRFLQEARPLSLRTHVMLTLTRANMSQVLTLGQDLRGLVSRFTFNRLAQVGNGANLTLPERDEYIGFLQQYRAAARENLILRLKDNLFCLLPQHGKRNKHQPMRGCTGHGCGAAFNFVALLPDGEMHACRKFPSPIGDIRASSLEAIYQSEAARQYRDGPVICRQCKHQQHCRGCMAVVYGRGLDPLHDCDPFCFVEEVVSEKGGASGKSGQIPVPIVYSARRAGR